MTQKQDEKNPLSDAVYYILISLIEPLHGYAIMQHVEEISAGNMKIGPATLYTSLTKLQENKLIVACEDIVQSDERRKPYTLTEKGKDALQAETLRRKKIAQDGMDALKKIGRE